MNLYKMTKKELIEHGKSLGLSLDIKDKKDSLISNINNLKEGKSKNIDTEVGAFKQLINTIWDYIGRVYVILILIIGMSPLIFFFWIATQPGAESQCLPLGSMC